MHLRYVPLRLLFWIVVSAVSPALSVQAAPKKVAVFVALCDNATQGIVPVPKAIGDGNKPEANLYWGCSDGLAGCFGASKTWKLQAKEKPQDARVFERRIYLHSSGSVQVEAEAWKGAEIAGCLRAFENALVSGEYDLCAFIGHNTLMDAPVKAPEAKAAKPADAIVLCCMSERYFKDRLQAINARPVLLTTQLMYPGAFLLRDGLPVWAEGGTPQQIRQTAANAYAKNQKISTKAAAGVFAALP